MELDKPLQSTSRSRKWIKRQMNKYIRLKGKEISDDEVGFKHWRKEKEKIE